MSDRVVLILGVIALIGALAACGSAPPPAPVVEEPPAIAVTLWSPRTELFVEFPPLVAGAEARFAIHLTDLEDFAPLREGRVVVRFEGEAITQFEVDGPSTPGIFGVDVTVPAARRYQMAIEVHAPGLTDEHRVGAVTVYPTLDEAVAAIEESEEGATAFLKEQQWTLEFATMQVDERARREVIVVPATIEPRTGGSADVRAMAAGRIARGGDRAVGTRVGRGEALAELVVRNERVGESPILRLELSNAEAELRLAEQTLARTESLATAGAIPARRLDEARVGRDTAAARVQIAEEHLRHLELSRSGEGAGEAGERVVLRAPIAGVIAESFATAGATVEAGEILYRIVTLDRVHVVGAVPEQQLSRVQDAMEAEIVVPGLDPLRTSRRVSVGRVVDRQARSVPVVFVLDDPPAAVAIGQTVSLRLIGPDAAGGVTIPASAVVDDAGQPIVFVQTGGERFERRPVRLGSAREGGYVQIVSGLDAGERIVSRGAHLVRLAALSPQTPGHGHVH
ncbi:MAG: efflux RND transporter periplasmic adaptor subunit [Vicinamibacterales bacterium]|nr:efflux RND transporter periplasmic adaptor subunit [Vicinamibacterales bacterium]